MPVCPQPSDTHPDAARVQIELLRRATVAQRLGLALRLSSYIIGLSRMGIARAHPRMTPRSVDLLFVDVSYGRDLAQRVRAYLEAREI